MRTVVLLSNIASLTLTRVVLKTSKSDALYLHSLTKLSENEYDQH